MIAPRVRDLRQGCLLSNNFADYGAMVMNAHERVDDVVAKGTKLHCANAKRAVATASAAFPLASVCC